MLLVLGGAIRAVVSGASLSDVAGVVVFLLAVFAFFGIRYLHRTKAIQEQADFERLARKVAAKRDAQAPRALVGLECAQCARRIVIESDGRRCAACGDPVHDDCATLHAVEAHTVAAYR